MTWYKVLPLAFLIYAIQWFVVCFSLGIVTRFEMTPGVAARLAATWPVRIPYRVIRWLVIYIYQVIFTLVTHRKRMRAMMVARLEDQHRSYLKGLMDKDDQAYNRGLYGEYPPLKWEEAVVGGYNDGVP